MGLFGYDYQLDPPREPESWPCSTCDESGFLCLNDAPCRTTGFVTGVKYPSAICEREHHCPMCKGTGRLVADANDRGN